MIVRRPRRPCDRAAAGGGPAARDRGSVTAELAVALPVVMVVLLLAASTLVACTRQVLLQDASADAARLIARGETEARAAGVIASAAAGASMAVERRGDLVCVRATLPVRLPVPAPPLAAVACALDGGL